MKKEHHYQSMTWAAKAISERLGCTYSYALLILKRGNGTSLLAKKILILSEKLRETLKEEIIIKD